MLWLSGKKHHARREAVAAEAIRTVVDNRDVLQDGALEQMHVAAASPAILLPFHHYMWATRSQQVRRWLLSLISLNLVLLGFDSIVMPNLFALSCLLRGVCVSAVLGCLYVVWSRPRFRILHSATLALASSAIMIAAGILGIASDNMMLQRFLTGGIFMVGTGIVFLPLSLHWTVWTSVLTIAIDVAFLAIVPSGEPLSDAILIGFHIAVLASMAATCSGLNVDWRGFLFRVRETCYQQELKRLNDELWIAANFDPLTGIPNRRSAKSHVERLWDDGIVRTSGVAFIMADIDSFKLLNDTQGHAVGDRCIQAVAAAIQGTLSDRDIVSRHGGEEFLIVLSSTTLTSATATAERMRASVKALAIGNPGSATAPVVTISLGVAMADEQSGPERTLRRADEALYEAKRNGRDCVVIAADELPARMLQTPDIVWRSDEAA